MANQRIALTREDLYLQVWSEPIVHVAARLGISGRGLGKLCARYRIPVPPRGWWAKKQHGHRVRQIPLPAVTAKEKIMFEPGDAVQEPESDPFEITGETSGEWRIEVPEDLAISHPLVKRAASAIRKASRAPKSDVVRWQNRYQSKLLKPDHIDAASRHGAHVVRHRDLHAVGRREKGVPACRWRWPSAPTDCVAAIPCFDVASNGRFLLTDLSKQSHPTVSRMDLIVNWTSTLPK